ncbi:MAG: dUTP diphosphatase [Candidatus Izemoplasmatales bacterium]
MRGFKIVSAYAEKNVKLPERSTAGSAGYDIAAAEDTVIPPKGTAVVPTGIKAYMLPDEVLQVYARSSLSKKKGLMLANSVGIIDADYYDNADNEGHIQLHVYNFSEAPVTLAKGERFCQGVFQKFLVVDAEAPVTNVRRGGHGSTGY